MASKADIDQWVASQGGVNAVKYTYEDVDVDNPAFNNPDHPNYQGRTHTPDKVKTRRETWTNPTTGAVYSAVRTPYANDEFQDIKESQGTKPATPARTPSEQVADAKAIQEKKEREKNAAWPKDQDPRYETDAEREARGKATIAAQGAAADRDADNKRADEAAQRQAQAANRPSVTLTDDGRGGKVAVITTPGADGKPPTVTSQPVPGVQGTPPQLTLNNRVYDRQPDGTYKDVTPQAPQLPSDVPRFQPDPSRPEYGMPDFLAALQEYRKSHTLTDDQITTIVKQAHDSAVLEQTRLTGVANVQQQARADALTQRSQDIQRQNSLGSNATSAFATATEAGNKLIGAIAPGKWAGNVVTPALGPWAANMAATGGLSGGPPGVPTPPLLAAMGGWGLPAQPPAVPGAGPVPTVAPTPAPMAPAEAEAQHQQQAAASAAGQGASTTGPTGQVPRPGGADIPPPTAPAPSPSRAVDSQPGAPMFPQPSGSGEEMVTVETASGMRMRVPRNMVGEGPGKYSADPARGGFHLVDDAGSPLVTTPGGNPAGDPSRMVDSQPGAPALPTPDSPVPPQWQYDPTYNPDQDEQLPSNEVTMRPALLPSVAGFGMPPATGFDLAAWIARRKAQSRDPVEHEVLDSMLQGGA